MQGPAFVCCQCLEQNPGDYVLHKKDTSAPLVLYAALMAGHATGSDADAESDLRKM